LSGARGAGVQEMSIFPKLKDVGEVIAERALILEQRGKRRKKVTIRLGKPQVFPDGYPDYFCPFQILGLGEDEVRCAAGVDAFQALQLVQKMIAADLHWYDKRFGQGFYWLEKGDDLGFANPTLQGATADRRKGRPNRRARH